jgi:tetratricopeptide (TPR) repeat protein
MHSKTTRVLFLLLLPMAMAFGGSYGTYDSKKLLTSPESNPDRKQGLDLKYLDQMLSDLADHARNYPTQFESLQDRLRAIEDVKALSKLFDILLASPNMTPGLLRRAALLYSIGHNLDIQGAAQKASNGFERLLKMVPEDPQGNFMYGVFLGGSGRSTIAIPYLEKALSLGVTDANYSLGMSYIALGNKEKAIFYFKQYKITNPNDKSTDEILTAIENGRIGVKNTTN